MEEVDAMISEAVLNARSVAFHDSTIVAKVISETASEAKTFRLRLTDVESSMKIIRIETAKLAKLTFDLSRFRRRIDILLTMAHKSLRNLEMAQKELAVLVGSAELAKEKQGASNDKLDAKIKKTKKDLKSVRKSIESEGVEASTLQQQEILLAEQITHYKEEKLKVDARLGEMLDAAVNEMTIAKAKLKNEEQ
ncbi:hypothetical protein OROHE_014170 [Orobanche hederae]